MRPSERNKAYSNPVYVEKRKFFDTVGSMNISNGLIFNIHDVVLIMIAGLGLLLAITVLLAKNRSLSDALLIAFLLTQGAVAFNFLILFNPFFSQYTKEPIFMVPLVALQTLQGMLLVWYSRAKSKERETVRRLDLFIIFSMLLLLATPSVLALLFEYEQVNVVRFYRRTLSGLSMFISLIYGIYAIRHLRGFDACIRQRFSNIEHINLLWLQYSIYGFVAIWGAKVLIVPILSWLLIGSWTPLNVANGLGLVTNYVAMFLMCWMVVIGLHHRPITITEFSDKNHAGNGNGEKENFDEKKVEHLENLMESVKVYRDPELDLDGLSDSMGISPRSLSKLLNGHYHKSFYDFVNQFRIEDAKQQLLDPANGSKHVQRIFEDAGFTSKTTFNTYFKRTTGKTPTEFRYLENR